MHTNTHTIESNLDKSTGENRNTRTPPRGLSDTALSAFRNGGFFSHTHTHTPYFSASIRRQCSTSFYLFFAFIRRTPACLFAGIIEFYPRRTHSTCVINIISGLCQRVTYFELGINNPVGSCFVSSSFCRGWKNARYIYSYLCAKGFNATRRREAIDLCRFANVRRPRTINYRALEILKLSISLCKYRECSVMLLLWKLRRFWCVVRTSWSVNISKFVHHENVMFTLSKWYLTFHKNNSFLIGKSIFSL